MPHESGIQWPPEGTGLVKLSFSVRSEMVTLGDDNVFISTGADTGIRVPRTVVMEAGESGYTVFEALVPSDVAAAVISICARLFPLGRTEKEG